MIISSSTSCNDVYPLSRSTQFHDGFSGFWAALLVWIVPWQNKILATAWILKPSCLQSERPLQPRTTACAGLWLSGKLPINFAWDFLMHSAVTLSVSLFFKKRKRLISLWLFASSVWIIIQGIFPGALCERNSLVIIEMRSKQRNLVYFVKGGIWQHTGSWRIIHVKNRSQNQKKFLSCFVTSQMILESPDLYSWSFQKAFDIHRSVISIFDWIQSTKWVYRLGPGFQ